MQISPINNTQPQFGAKLPKRDINSILTHYSKESAYHQITKEDTMTIVPKLYTLLDLLDKIPGKKAEITSVTSRSVYRSMNGYPDEFTVNTLRIDGYEVEKSVANPYWLLYGTLTSYKTKDGRTIGMPLSVFDQMWWKNRDKTQKDLEKFYYSDSNIETVPNKPSKFEI